MLYGYPHYSQEIVGEGDHRAPLCYRLTPCRFHVRRLLGYIVRHALRILQAGGADVNKADIWNRSMNAAFRKSQRQNGVELIATLRNGCGKTWKKSEYFLVFALQRKTDEYKEIRGFTLPNGKANVRIKIASARNVWKLEKPISEPVRAAMLKSR